jgi:peptidoglycan hydrolase-like protein with peptidoglycan-binding domain
VPETRSRRGVASRDASLDEGVGAEGLIGTLVDRACDNPARTGGLFVMALTASAIVSNALLLQNADHPEPLFATRPPLVVDRTVPQPAPLPPARDEQVAAVQPPLPRPAPIEPTPAPQAAEPGMVQQVQALLARKGFYLGAIDGEYGPLSRSAIVAYQKAEGLEVTGEPSQGLLEHLEQPAARVAVAASRPPAPAAAALPQVEETVAASERLRYERIQAALNRIGYGPVAIDGLANEETANAIRRFELDNGLPISGVAGEAVIDRLIAIGALPAT